MIAAAARSRINIASAMADLSATGVGRLAKAEQ